MQKRLVTRYAMRSAEAADENQRRVEGVFAELAASKPGNVSYIVLRLADDSFVHVSFHDHGDDEVNPIASTAAFCPFSAGPRRSSGRWRRPADRDPGRCLHHDDRLTPLSRHCATLAQGGRASVGIEALSG